MEDFFDLPVQYMGEVSFPARLVRTGYTYRIEVDVRGTTVFFERDEEGTWRVLGREEDISKNKKVDRGLLEAIANTLDQIAS